MLIYANPKPKSEIESDLQQGHLGENSSYSLSDDRLSLACKTYWKGGPLYFFEGTLIETAQGTLLEGKFTLGWLQLVVPILFALGVLSYIRAPLESFPMIGAPLLMMMGFRWLTGQSEWLQLTQDLEKLGFRRQSS